MGYVSIIVCLVSIIVRCGKTFKVDLLLIFFEFVINVMLRHLLCFLVLCWVGSVAWKRYGRWWVEFDSALYGMTVIVGLRHLYYVACTIVL